MNDHDSKDAGMDVYEVVVALREDIQKVLVYRTLMGMSSRRVEHELMPNCADKKLAGRCALNKE